MAATRLSDSQKSELVARFRAGEGSQVLATAFGCSTATVSRTVRAALAPEEYDRLKQAGGRRPAVSPSMAPEPLTVSPVTTASAAGVPEREPRETLKEPLPSEEVEDGPDPSESVPGELAIDDADDFGDDENPDDDDENDNDEDDFGDDGLEEADENGSSAGMVLTALGISSHEGPAVEARPLADATLPASAYMLVDKTVELQARALNEFPELGLLAPGEQDRQALVVYVNPRQAKRQCGRSQRVIKIPDLGVFARTSRFLMAQGISRLLIEGDLYSLPGS